MMYGLQFCRCVSLNTFLKKLYKYDSAIYNSRIAYQLVKKFSSQTNSNISKHKNANNRGQYGGGRPPSTGWTFSIFSTFGAIVAWSLLSIRSNKKNNLSVLPSPFVTATCTPNNVNFLADVVDKTAPAVVHIQRLYQGQGWTGENVSVPESEGSGFIIRDDGLILTNAHVVGNKNSVKVKLRDGRSFDGVVQAVDRVSDLATVKIKASGLPMLKLGSSSTTRPGEWVVAMGSPLRLSNTVTHGIVSSTTRQTGELGGFPAKGIDYIQTDAVIDIGNSGGPLVNMEGEAIGINTFKVTAGISFAIPSDYAKKFVQKAASIEKRTSVKTGSNRYIGIRMLTLTPDIINQLMFRMGDQQMPNVSHGVLVIGVTVQSPAHSAGVLPGDVITKINNTVINSASDVYSLIEKESNLSLQVHRGAQQMMLKVQPSEN